MSEKSGSVDDDDEYDEEDEVGSCVIGRRDWSNLNALITDCVWCCVIRMWGAETSAACRKISCWVLVVTVRRSLDDVSSVFSCECKVARLTNMVLCLFIS